MRYMGSKARLAKYLLSIILKDRQSWQWYVEPFAGGFNMIDKVTGPRLANDINPYVTALYQALLDGWNPPPPEFVSEGEYQAIKANPLEYLAYLVGFVGFGCSYSGKFWGGYARGGFSADGQPRNYCRESRDNLIKQINGLRGVTITCKPYTDLVIPNNSIVYCDPPYAITTGYKVKFDHPLFWDWARGLHSQGHQVFVSEYKAPQDFNCVWEKEVSSSIVLSGRNVSIEKLYALKSTTGA